MTNNFCMLYQEHKDLSSNVTVVRRSNLLLLLRDFKREHLSRGGDLQAVEREFAQALEVHPTMLSHLKARRPISDKVARQIEAALKISRGWMDQVREIEASVSPGEEAFVEMARKAWRLSNAKAKRELRTLLIAHMERQA
jgi:hypothetical protein